MDLIRDAFCSSIQETESKKKNRVVNLYRGFVLVRDIGAARLVNISRVNTL